MKNKEGGINGIIYGARNTVTEKWYIGQTVNYKQRKQNHLAAANHIGVSSSQVAQVLTGKHKTAGGGYDKNAGYTFKYKNENPDR